MKSMMRIMAVLVAVVSLALVWSPRAASAHPMGNFSINHYSALTVGDGRVDVRYIIDMAEIPTFQDLGAIRPDHSANLTAEQRESYIATKSAELLKGLSLSVNSNTTTLSIEKTSLSFPEGAGGLPTTRIEMQLSVSIVGLQNGMIEYRDDNFPGRAGWKEITATPGKGVSVSDTSVGSTDVTDALTKYPTDSIAAPPSVVAASLQFTVVGVPASGASGQTTTQRSSESALSGTVTWAQARADALTELIAQKELPLGALLIGLVVAFFLGAGHALSPGHGKTVVAAYLVGSRGTAAHAALLGATVTLSHTVGVFLLGLVVLYAENYILPDALYPWLGFASGLGIALMGGVLFLQRLRSWRRARTAASSSITHTHEHDHEHESVHVSDEHDHDHDHHHEHSHSPDAWVPHKHGLFSKAHTHLPSDGQKVTLGSLLALGITGGIIPCPSALVVLLVAIASHRVGLGLVLIVAFSLGLAAVLTGIGLLMVYSRNLLSRFDFGKSGLLGRLPIASAVAVGCMGVVIAFEALKTGGILR